MFRHLYGIQRALKITGIEILALDLKKSVALSLEWVRKGYNYNPCIVTEQLEPQTLKILVYHICLLRLLVCIYFFHLNALYVSTFCFEN